MYREVFQGAGLDARHHGDGMQNLTDRRGHAARRHEDMRDDMHEDMHISVDPHGSTTVATALQGECCARSSSALAWRHGTISVCNFYTKFQAW